jgi:hypothetical protein
VHTVYDPIQRRIDHGAPKGYHVIFNDSGTNYDYLPAFPQPGETRTSGKACVHIKRNVPQNAKRGVTDFYPIQSYLEREYILGRNLSVGGAIQAAIAGIEEHAEGVSETQARTELTNALDQISKVVSARNGNTTQKFEPGTILRIRNGKKWMAGPLGELRSPIYIEIAGYLMRAIGIRWLMPEYMISGDASNANFASTLVAESPFVKARESDQRGEVRTYRRIMRCCIKIAYDNGRFDRWSNIVRNWGDLMRLVELNIKPPIVASRDKSALLAEDQALFDEGLLTGNEWRIDTNREPMPGQDKVKAPAPAPIVPFGKPGEPPLDLKGRLSAFAAKESADARTAALAVRAMDTLLRESNANP